METIIVNNSKSPTRIHVQVGAREITTPEGGKRLECDYHTIKLKIGATRLSKKDAQAWEQAVKLPVVQHMLESERLSIKDAPLENRSWKKGEKIKDLSDFKLLDALSAVALCKSAKQLRSWMYQDSRPEVQKAITERHEALNPKDSSKDDTDGDQPTV